jgi:hypothetical protein
MSSKNKKASKESSSEASVIRKELVQNTSPAAGG